MCLRSWRRWSREQRQTRQCGWHLAVHNTTSKEERPSSPLRAVRCAPRHRWWPAPPRGTSLIVTFTALRVVILPILPRPLGRPLRRLLLAQPCPVYFGRRGHVREAAQRAQCRRSHAPLCLPHGLSSDVVRKSSRLLGLPGPLHAAQLLRPLRRQLLQQLVPLLLLILPPGRAVLEQLVGLLQGVERPAGLRRQVLVGVDTQGRLSVRPTQLPAPQSGSASKQCTGESGSRRTHASVTAQSGLPTASRPTGGRARHVA